MGAGRPLSSADIEGDDARRTSQSGATSAVVAVSLYSGWEWFTLKFSTRLRSYLNFQPCSREHELVVAEHFLAR